MIRIICVGKLKESYLKEAIHEYQKRLQKYTALEIIEVMDEGLLEPTVALKKEQAKIEEYLLPKTYLITLEIEGKQMSSVEFAKQLDQLFLNHSHLTFLIGGSYGLSEELKRRANLRLSFSKMTFPHQLFRVLLLEQIYRSYKINHNENYHK